MAQPPDDQGGERSRSGAVIGLIVVLALVVAAVYLVHALQKESHLEDCLMSGRTQLRADRGPFRRTDRRRGLIPATLAEPAGRGRDDRDPGAPRQGRATAPGPDGQNHQHRRPAGRRHLGVHRRGFARIHVDGAQPRRDRPDHPGGRRHAGHQPAAADPDPGRGYLRRHPRHLVRRLRPLAIRVARLLRNTTTTAPTTLPRRWPNSGWRRRKRRRRSICS